MAGRDVNYIKNLVLNKLVTENFDRLLAKVNIVSGGGGQCTAEFRNEAPFRNTMGNLHGGCIAWLVNTISTLALATFGKGASGVSATIQISYLKAASANEVVVVAARVIRSDGKTVYIEVDVKNKRTGDWIAKCSHTKFLS